MTPATTAPAGNPAPGCPPPLLEAQALSVELTRGGASVRPVDEVSLAIAPRETLVLVGESGCGKSLLALALLALVPAGGRLVGRVVFEGRDLLTLPDEERRRVRGARIGVVFQEPAAAFTPVHTVGAHLVETLAVHGVARGREARARAVALLADVALPDPAAAADAYPHQLSGGMQQRAMLALALACDPVLLIADEPTTALDVTTQTQVLELLAGLRDRRGLALLLVTHDLAVAAHLADRIAVMYAGQLVEEGPAAALLATAAHPYTRALLAAVPRGAPRRRLPTIGGAVPLPEARPTGCRFAPRCPVALDACRDGVPPSVAVGAGHRARCLLPPPPHGPTAAGSPECR